MAAYSDTNGEMYHVKVKPGDIGRYCILPGDPGRCKFIAGFLEDPCFVSSNREYTVYNGFLSGCKITVCSTGIGGPSAAIAIEELCACGADTFIRVGTCGGIDTKVVAGDIVIPTAAIRAEGTSREYLPVEFPAAADFSVVSALYDACRRAGSAVSCHVGVVQSKDSFYGQHSPERMPVAAELLARWEAYKRGGALGSEMECAAVFSVSLVLGARAGAVIQCVANQEREKAGLPNPQKLDKNAENGVRAAIEGLKLLIERDSETQ